MRLLLDTNALIYWITDKELLSDDARNMIDDYSNIPCVSTETLRELVVLFNNGGIVSRYWISAAEMLKAFGTEIMVDVLPLDANVMRTYANLQINTVQDHRDPSDHVIISHAITLGIPLISSDRKFPFYKSQGLDLMESKR